MGEIKAGHAPNGAAHVAAAGNHVTHALPVKPIPTDGEAVIVSRREAGASRRVKSSAASVFG